MKRLHPLLFVTLLALSVWLTLRHRAPRAKARVTAQATHPATFTELALPGAALVASLDLDALRSSLWGQAALEQLLPLASKDEECMRKALAQVTRLALTIPAEGSTSAAPELAVIAEGKLEALLLLDCAMRVMRAHGGEPELSRLGSFQRLLDKKGTGELAVRNGGPLILGGGTYFRALVARGDATRRGADGAREQIHAALRREFGPAPLLLSWVLGPGWLERWLDDPEVKRSPLAEVRALVLRGDVGEQLSLSAMIAAENASGAKRIETFLQATQAELRPLFDAALGPGQSQRISIVHSGSRVEVTVRTDTRALVARWLEQTPLPAEFASHPLGSAHAQEPQPQPQRAPRRAADDKP